MSTVDIFFMNIFQNFSAFSFDIVAGTAPPLSDLGGFNPAAEPGLVNAGGRAVSGNGDVIDHWFFSSAIPDWIEYILSFGAAAAVLMVVVGGVMIMVSGEEEEYKTRGIKTVVWSIVGLFVAVLSYTIVEIVNQVPLTGDSPQTNLIVSDEGAVAGLATGELRTYIIPTIIKMILQIMGSVALGLLLYAGGLMVLRDGDEERISKARTLIIYALLGVLVSALSYVLIDAILQINFTEEVSS